MRKKCSMLVLLLILVLCTAAFLACGSTGGSDDVVSGLVTTCGGDSVFFELEGKDGKNYGFVTEEETQIIWEDESAFSIWENTSIEYDDWDVFGCSMQVTVVPGEETEPADEYVETDSWRYAKRITVTKVEEDYFAVSAKPVIYLYPEKEEKVSVELEYDGSFTCTYPEYHNGWEVTAFPDGSLLDENGIFYNYLYWEGINQSEYDFSEGFCISGEDTAAFLETALSKLGLSRREANEFIVYWLPLMEKNPYNLISFQQEAYTKMAELKINPTPDTLIRVFMAWKPLKTPEEIPVQELLAPERTGFTVVEWGGCQVTE